MKKSALKAAEFTFDFLDNEYGASSYNSAFSTDMNLTIPDPALINFLMAVFMSALKCTSKEAIESLRDVQKGLRDVQRVDEGLSNFRGHGAIASPFILMTGGFYAILLLASRWDKERQLKEIEENCRMALHLRTLLTDSHTKAMKFRINEENNAKTHQLRLAVQATTGGLTGLYLGFSVLQVTEFVFSFTPSIVINPLPFVITGIVLAAVFCAKRLYDQYRLDLKKSISVLACKVELGQLSCKQLQNDIALNKGSALAGKLRQQLIAQEKAVAEHYQQLASMQKKLNSATQLGNNFLNISQKTISTIKNTSVGLLNLGSFVSFTGVTTLKILSGATALSILGGPAGVALMAITVTCALLYVGYNMYKRHKEQQNQKLPAKVETDKNRYSYFYKNPGVTVQHCRTGEIELIEYNKP